VRFEVTGDFLSAGYCHCLRCQHRSGTLYTFNGMVPADGFSVIAGEDAIRTWRPPNGHPKSFCVHCGGHVYSGEPGGEGTVGVRFGALESDPGIAPRWHQWVASAPDWAPLPEDGLPRFDGARTID
jgi:hypothetical protein